MEWFDRNKDGMAKAAGSFAVNVLIGWLLMGLCPGLVCFSTTLKMRISNDQKKIVAAQQQEILIKRGVTNERTMVE